MRFGGPYFQVWKILVAAVSRFVIRYSGLIRDKSLSQTFCLVFVTPGLRTRSRGLSRFLNTLSVFWTCDLCMILRSIRFEIEQLYFGRFGIPHVFSWICQIFVGNWGPLKEKTKKFITILLKWHPQVVQWMTQLFLLKMTFPEPR